MNGDIPQHNTMIRLYKSQNHPPHVCKLLWVEWGQTSVRKKASMLQNYIENQVKLKKVAMN